MSLLTAVQQAVLDFVIDYLRKGNSGRYGLDERAATKFSTLYLVFGYSSQIKFLEALRDEPVLTITSAFNTLIQTATSNPVIGIGDELSPGGSWSNANNEAESIPVELGARYIYVVGIHEQQISNGDSVYLTSGDFIAVDTTVGVLRKPASKNLNRSYLLRKITVS